MLLYHDSHNPIYRSPFGASPTGGAVTLRLRVDPAPDLVVARLWYDGNEALYPMKKVGPLYEAVCRMPGEPCLMWYYFYAEKDGTRCYLGNADDHLGGEGAMADREPPSYQITVYDGDYQTPAWMRESVFYQILPDRFRASRPMNRRRKPPCGHLHETWLEDPEPYKDDQPNAGDDFFGGDLDGIRQKLPYLESLGINAIYLNPIFRAASNHKYDTGDYRQIDPSFGTEEDFIALCREAGQRGIRVMIDGVFSHTGADSRYFNRYDNYNSLGAYQSEDSPYAGWYRFRRFPDDYEAWWGFPSLPDVDEMNPDYQDFILNGPDPVIRHWLRDGASGWRLDVADELPVPFLRALRRSVKSFQPDAAILGEVWEDASNKCAYGEMRDYCAGDMLDSVMNYPLRSALVDFMLGTLSAEAARRKIRNLQENYPQAFFYSLYNLLGSHDRPRIISVLAGEEDLDPPAAKRRAYTLSKEAYQLGCERFTALWQLVCALPGMPALYYGDEAGLTGMADPYCRGPFPWGQEDQELTDKIRRIALDRRGSRVLQTGELRLYAPREDVLVAARRIVHGKDVFGQSAPDGLVLVAVNRSEHPALFRLPTDSWLHRPLEITVPARSALRLEPDALPDRPFDPDSAHWVSRPDNSRIEADAVSITTRAGVDLWKPTYFGYHSDEMPGLLMESEETYFSFQFDLRFPAANAGDQAGVVLYQDAENWIRVAVEKRKDNGLRATSVVTKWAMSDWANLLPLDPAARLTHFRLSRRENGYLFEISQDEQPWERIRVCRLPGRQARIRFGVFAASPGETAFTARFEQLRLTPCAWEE